MSKVRLSDIGTKIENREIVNETEPKVIEIHIGIEGEDTRGFSADLSDSQYELIDWILSDMKNIEAVLESAKRRRAKVGKPKKEKGE